MNNMEQKKEQIQCISRKDVQIATSLNKIPAASSFMSNKFFEVTINSQKLSELLNNINEYMFQQDKKIDKISKDIQSMTSSLQNKFQSESRKNGLLFTKLDLRIGQSSNTQHCYLTDVHKKAEQRDLQLSNKIDILRSKIGKVEDSYKQDLKNGLIYLKKQIIGQSSILKVDESPARKDDTIKGQSPKFDFNSIIEHFNGQLEKVKSSMSPVFNQLYQLKQNEKKKQHTHDMFNLAAKKQQMQAISALKEEKDFGNMKIIYPSSKKGIGTKQNQSNENVTKVPNNRIRHMSYTKMSGIQEQMIETYRQMSDKVYMLDNMMTQQSQIIADMKNKIIVLDQKTMILTRKLQKNCQQTAEIKNSIRRIQNQKLDDRTIDELRNHVKWNLRDMEQKIIKKCSEEDLQKQKMRVTQKLSIIHQNLIQKADKGQIQKALLFLENKIKQIIFLIAAQQSEERQGAIMKVAAKCLSCDKQVERQLQMQSNCKRELSKQSQGQYIKSMTHRVRQRYKKEIAKTLGNQTFDD